jgi:imidazolonepropionase-like amidohydrolase
MTAIGLFPVAFALAQSGNQLEPGLAPFLAFADPLVALTHVRIIDGTGAPPVEDQTVIIDHGRIAALNAPAPSGARVLDLRGRTVIPGLVGMHEHLFYPAPGGTPVYHEMAYSFPRLYLAAGVTAARTGGSIEPYTDLNLKALIDSGRMPGPRLFITGPYLEGKGSFAPQLHELTGPADATRTVEYWAEEGATSFKAYMHITRAELSAAVVAAHKRGLKITGHLCSVGFREAAQIGIDNLEHGLLEDTEFQPGKAPDVCPSVPMTEVARLDVNSQPVREMIADLVRHSVAITSTLAVFEAFDPDRPPLDQRLIDALAPKSAAAYLASRARGSRGSIGEALKRELEFEYAFVKAGGVLMAGADPTGNGGALAGFADQRNIELLVEGGFTPVEAIQIATSNGARFLGDIDHFGTIARGKIADVIVINGNPAEKIADIRKVELVFKDGAAYDPAKLLDTIRQEVGVR